MQAVIFASLSLELFAESCCGPYLGFDLILVQYSHSFFHRYGQASLQHPFCLIY